MQWTRKELAALALPTCAVCDGCGVRRERHGLPVPCGCALRAVFRTCYVRFRSCAARGKYRSPAGFDRAPSAKGYKGTWGRKEEEYMADFTLVARRTLDAWHHRLFRYHFLLGAGSSLVSRRMQITRGKFFHGIYRIEEQLGRAFYELEPYALYPPRAYFTYRHAEPVKPCDPRNVLPKHKEAGRRAAERLKHLPRTA